MTTTEIQSAFKIVCVDNLPGRNVYRVTRVVPSADWPADRDLIRACDGYGGAPFGGKVSPIHPPNPDAREVSVYTD